MIHLEQEWFKRSLEAHHKGKGKIYGFGSLALRDQHRKFYEQGLDKRPAYDRYFHPNPFTYQYDLMVHCWFNFREILNQEVSLLRERAIKQNKDLFSDAADQITQSGTLYGIRREDFMYGACELRWPSMKIGEAYRGPLVRDPWMEERVEAFSDEHYKFIMSFGGGGQGKTLCFIGLNLVLWDHFIFTQKGARCLISTVSKDKLESASWSYLQQLINSTEKDISLYAGRGVIAGDYTIKRPNNKDAAGVYKGILLANRLDDQAITDKLTGSHGHPYFGYIMDEAQSTPEAPIKASSNYTMHAGDFRIVGCGNYGEDSDTLGKNVKPTTGWDTVDQDTGKWLSYLTNHQPAIVLHFSNDRSPGMNIEGAKRFPYLPNQKKLSMLYKRAESRTIQNKSYRRFWLGWRIENEEADAIISKATAQATGSSKPLNLSSVLHTFFSFDSAQGEGDRNMLGILQEGEDVETGERVWGPTHAYESFKSSDALSYFIESTKWILDKCKLHGIKSGQGILDWTGRPAQAELLRKGGFETHQLTYHQSVPDGKTKNSQTGFTDPAILVDPDNMVYAHQLCSNRISFASWLLQQYIQSGRVKNINETILETLKENHGPESELYSMRFEIKISQKYGELFNRASKKNFIQQYGFSPDFFDMLCQGAYYMFMIRHLPINPLPYDGEEKPDFELDLEAELRQHMGVWEDDLIPEL